MPNDEQSFEETGQRYNDDLNVVRPLDRQTNSILDAEQRCRLLYETMVQGVVYQDADGTIISMNPAAEQILGRTAEEFLGSSSVGEEQNTIREDGSPFPGSEHPAMVALRTGWRVRDVVMGVYNPQMADYRWINITAVPLFHREQDKPRQVYTIFDDITERKKSEKALTDALAEAEEGRRILQALMEHVPEGITIADGPDATIRMVSRFGQDLLGGPHEHMTADEVAHQWKVYRQDGVTPMAVEDLPLVRAFRDGAVLRNQELVQINTDGRRLYLSCNAGPICDASGIPVGAVVTWRDVTEVKEAEKALRRSEERLRLALDAAYVVSFEWDIQRNEVRRFVSNEPALAPTEEETPSTFEGVREVVHPEDRERFTTAVRAALEHEDGLYENEFRVVRPDGKVAWLYERGLVQLDAQGHAARLIGLSQDITERKKTEERLFEINQRLEALMRALPVGVSFSEDPTCQRIAGNPAVLAQFEVGPQDNLSASSPDPDAPGRQVRFFLEGRQIRDVELPLQRAVAEGRDIPPMELKVELPSGRRWFTQVSGAPIRDAGGKVVAGVAVTVDITARKQAEDALRRWNATLEAKIDERTAELESRTRQLQKLALELSEVEDRERKRLAEILHDDLQQQLAGTKFHVGLLARTVRENAEAHDIALQIKQMLMDAIEKSRDLSHELSPPMLYQADLEDTFDWLGHKMRMKHGLTVRVSGSSVYVHSDPLKAFLYRAGQELLFNIVKHAKVNEACVRIRRLGWHVGLMVSDRGCGFARGALAGTPGFGLLSIRERVELLGGRMKLRSSVGEGSRFLITVPDAEPSRESEGMCVAVQRPAEHPADTTKESQGREFRVVIADDHEIVRGGLAALFAEESDVELVGEATNGREAVDITYQLRPDVVIMDVSMPVMNGEEATRQIKTHVPGTRVIALSMFSDAEMGKRMREAGAEAYLLKTDSSEELLAAIRKR